jgi:predicted amidohydrolase
MVEMFRGNRDSGPVTATAAGIKLTDVSFSRSEAAPDFMLANISPRFDVAYNLSRMESIVQSAHEQGADILVFPELGISGYVWDDDGHNEVVDNLRAADNAQPDVKRVLDRIAGSLTAPGKGLNMVVFGNVRVNNEKNCFHDSAFVMAPGADYNGIFYDKIFLTPLEKKFFRRGTDTRLVIDSHWGRMGFMVCYDLCFVELGKRYAFEDEVDVIVVPAAWRMEAVRRYPLLNLKVDNYYQFIWILMNAALAAHNQVWSIGANCVGSYAKTGGRFCGESGIWGPSGLPLVQASSEEEELLIVRNIEIRGHMRHQATEDFDYSLDFDEVYRYIRDLEPRRFTL